MATAQEYRNTLPNPYENARCGCTITDLCLKGEALHLRKNAAFDYLANSPGPAQEKLYEGYAKQCNEHDKRARGVA